MKTFLTGFFEFETADFFGFCWIRWFGSWDFDFQNLNPGNETADLILTRGGLGLGVVALWGAHARQMSETAMSIPLFLFVFWPVIRVFCQTKALTRTPIGVPGSFHAHNEENASGVPMRPLGPSAGKSISEIL